MAGVSQTSGPRIPPLVDTPWPSAADPIGEWDPFLTADIVATMPVGLLVEDSAGRCWINDELRRLWKRDDSSPVRAGELEAALRPTSSAGSRGQPWGRLLVGAAGDEQWRRCVLSRDDGTLAPVRAWKRFVETNNVVQAATYVMEDAARDSDADFRQAFLAMVGHELRSPVTSVVAGAELLHGMKLEPRTRDEVAALLVEEAHRVHTLVDQLTTLTLLESAGSRLATEPVHLVHLARRVGVREIGRRPGLRLLLPGLEPRSAVVLGDEGFVAQVLTILIDNAAKYSARGTPVEVLVRPAGDEVAVHVLDRGGGLGGLDAARLFELFQRGRPDGAAPAGSGIGLYVAKQVVTAMQGRIWASDRDGGGADFGFALPAAR